MALHQVTPFPALLYKMKNLKDRMFHTYIAAEDYELILRLLFDVKDPEILFYVMPDPVIAVRNHAGRGSYD